MKNINYAQPPLCFYQSVIINFKFNNIVEQYPQICLLQNGLLQDIQILSNAYNLVGSVSSFFITLLIINENLNYLWEYDYYSLTQKYLHLHHDIYNFPRKYIIYRMNLTQKYMNEMFPWRNTKNQIQLMLNEKCKDFNIINSNI